MMHLLAQIEQAAEMVSHATAQSGWTAGLLVLLVLGALGLFAFMIRGDRNELREINRFVRTEMPDVIDGNSIITAKFVAALQIRPCLRDSDFQKLSTIDPRTIQSADTADLDGIAQKAVERIRRRAARRERREEESSNT